MKFDKINVAIIGHKLHKGTSLEMMDIVKTELPKYSKLGVSISKEINLETDAVILIGGDESSLSKIKEAYEGFIPITAFKNSGGLASSIVNTYLDERGLLRVRKDDSVNTLSNSVKLARSRQHLKSRLQEVGLDLQIYSKKPQRFIRIRQDSQSVSELEQRLDEEFDVQVKFEESGLPKVYSSSQNAIGGKIKGNENRYFESVYAIQDIASAFAVYCLGIRPGQTFLDMCASPGMKTQLAHEIAGGNLDIVAIDKNEKRYQKLVRHLLRYGVNADSLMENAIEYKKRQFDRVLVDAPCSCEGITARYNKDQERWISGFDSVISYSPEKVEGNSWIQRKLLQNGFDRLNEGGVLVYSTCSTNKIENDNNVDYFIARNPNAKIDLTEIPEPKMDYKVSELGVRVTPGKSRGMFFTRIRKMNS